MVDKPSFDCEAIVSPPSDPIVAEIDERVENDDWKSRLAQRDCVRRVAKRTLSGPADVPIEKRRRRAQERVADDLDVGTSTVQDHCGRQLFEGYEYGHLNRWTRMFDQLLADVERDRDSSE